MVCQNSFRKCQLITDVSENIRDQTGSLEISDFTTAHSSHETTMYLFTERSSEEIHVSISTRHPSTKSKLHNPSVHIQDNNIKTKIMKSSRKEGEYEKSVHHTFRSTKLPSDKSSFLRRERFVIYMLPRMKLNHFESASETLWRLYRKEILRLRTFQTYPSSASVSALVLANQGFVYVGTGVMNDDTVECYSCRIKKNNWQTRDDVYEVHRSLYRNCSMVTGINCDNEPLLDSLASNYQVSVSDTLTIGEGTSLKLNSASREDSAGLYSHMDDILQTDSSVEVKFAEESSVDQPTESSILATVTPNSIPPDTSTSNNLSTSHSLLENSLSDEINDTVNQIEETNTTPTNQEILNYIVPPTISTPQITDTTNSELMNSELVTQGITQQISVPSRPSRQIQINTLTYQELGIITERPKRPEYAIKIKRLETFSNSWPRDHHLNPLDLIEAGFYYAGYGDCTRCFYCGGGLRNWEDEDHEWVEHARWFPRCAYLRQMMGQPFVDEVQKLHKEYEKITYEMVKNKLGADSSTLMTVGHKNQSLKNDAAVKSLLELGYEENDILEVASLVKSESNVISADSLLSKLVSEGKKRLHDSQLTHTAIENIGMSL
ncbi:hypothetical protein Btru_068751 [Bulinus truncatus]|nr:hypothetical protein Btru_068751 [Bulinus truncatus]